MASRDDERFRIKPGGPKRPDGIMQFHYFVLDFILCSARVCVTIFWRRC